MFNTILIALGILGKLYLNKTSKKHTMAFRVRLRTVHPTQEHVVELPDGDRTTVSQLKALAAPQLGISAGRMRFICRGLTLRDADTLLSCGARLMMMKGRRAPP